MLLEIATRAYLRQASLNILWDHQSAPNWVCDMQTLTLIAFDSWFAAVSNLHCTDEELEEQETTTMPFVAVTLPAAALRVRSEGSALKSIDSIATSKRSAALFGRQCLYRKISVGCCPRAVLISHQCCCNPSAVPPLSQCSAAPFQRQCHPPS